MLDRTTNPGGPDVTVSLLGGSYSTDELAFLSAVERYKRDYKRPRLTWRESLYAGTLLGCRKIAAEIAAAASS